MFYDNFKAACARKGTTITAVLAEIGRASGNTGGWKMGKYPRLDIVTEIADYLNISLDDPRRPSAALQRFFAYSYGFYTRKVCR